MAEEIRPGPGPAGSPILEKHQSDSNSSDGNDGNLALADENINVVETELQVTEDDLLEAKEVAASFSLEDARRLMKKVYQLHHQDPNFPEAVIDKIELFLNNEDIYQNPHKHELLIQEIKIEAALITYNSPYAIVRSVVDNHDDPATPVSTIRAWIIGIIFAAAVAFVNGFFEPRQPAITVSSNVAQLLAFPAGKFLEKALPDVGPTIFGTRHSLNPGPFNRKEHMLITIMASIAPSAPYTNYIVWIQYLPQYFNQSWAKNFGYQITIALSTNFIGYGLAGLVRRWLVYPSYCVWPASLVTIALNQAFHTEGNIHVDGPFNSTWRSSRLKFFCIVFAAMFIYFWFPNYLFQALSVFSWMTWIAPANVHLANITGSWTGLGLNPVPSFDWNFFSTLVDPLMVPFFTTANFFAGSLISFVVIVAIYYSNAFNTAYLPINSNYLFDNTGAQYNVSMIVDAEGIFNEERYQQYSPPFLAASNIAVYIFFFTVYSATLTYGALYHWREISMGFKSFYTSIFKKTKEDVADDQLDIHNRLMQSYKEVPEWWYLIILAASIALGMAGIASWPTNTTPAVVIYGVAMCLVFIIPIGIIQAITGIQVTLNVLAEFIGGAWVHGNAISMSFFKSYGYITCAQALAFSNDLKLAHYVKIPPRMTFFAQMVPTIVSTFVCVGIMTYQLNLEGICTAAAPFRFTCPGNNSFFTAAVLWGTVGPSKMVGVGAYYSETLVGFPLGVVLVVVVWFLQKKFPKNSTLRSCHPVVMINGMLNWAPYNLAYIWPAVPVGALSWMYAKTRYLGLWSKYNFVLSAALSCAVAISAIIQFFALSYNDIAVTWWGNTVSFVGCDGTGACPYKMVTPGETFGPKIGHFG